MNPESYTKTGSYILVICPNPSVDIFAWVDQIAAGSTNRITKEKRYPGGKGVHVALALAELGEKVVLLGFWGGPTGTWIITECEKQHPNLKCIGPRTQDWTRSCLTFKSEGEFDETEILGKGPQLTATDLNSFFEIFNESTAQAKCIVLSGSWPKGIQGDEYQRLITIASQKRKASIVDCTGEQLSNALKSRPHTIHLNRSEFYDHLGEDNIDKGLALLLEQCERVALTDGANGLYLIDKHKTTHAWSKVDQVLSEVGSGDCLVAGLAVAFIKGLNATESARLGASCGAANCIRADLGMLFKKDVDALYDNTQIKVSQGHFSFV